MNILRISKSAAWASGGQRNSLLPEKTSDRAHASGEDLKMMQELLRMAERMTQRGSSPA